MPVCNLSTQEVKAGSITSSRLASATVSLRLVSAIQNLVSKRKKEKWREGGRKRERGVKYWWFHFRHLGSKKRKGPDPALKHT